MKKPGCYAATPTHPGTSTVSGTNLTDKNEVLKEFRKAESLATRSSLGITMPNSRDARLPNVSASPSLTAVKDKLASLARFARP